MSELRYLAGVVTLALDHANCGGCGVCVTVCPHGVLAIENRQAHIIDRDACMECGACARNCPDQAITVQAGVGCVAAIIMGALTGSESNCSGSDGPSCCG